MNGLFILGIILFIVAFIFIGIEMIIPGFGAPGIIGCCCLVAGVSLTANTYTQAIMIIAIVDDHLRGEGKRIRALGQAVS